MRILLERWKRHLHENVEYISISKILPTEELGRGKSHECPSEECYKAVEQKITQIKNGIFEPILVTRHKPVVTAKLQGDEKHTPVEKSPSPEPFYYILNGHHRLLAAQRLGLNKVPCIVDGKDK